jgi:redox-sensitive bicupin YhaK (pirin superfamily)
MVRPGEVNLMTGGRGISHSEISTDVTPVLHGAQLWVALPAHARDVAPGFAHYVPDAVTGDGWEARVLLGSLLGSTSPVETHTPLLGAEIVLTDGATLEVPVDESFEYGVLVDTGAVSLGDVPVAKDALGYVPPGTTTLRLTADGWTRVLLLGGPPFGEEIVMWWNFVGRSHEEIVAYRDEWQAQITDGVQVDGRFGVVAGGLSPIPAPPLPTHVRLRSRH